jgi:hypothetical protein
MDDRLFVIVRKDLTLQQQAVQAGHAVAEHLLRGYKWPNGTLIYLGVKNQSILKRWMNKLNDLTIPYSIFKEPDIGNEITALAVITDKCKVFKSLQTLKFV